MSDIRPSAVPHGQREDPKETWDDKVGNKSSQEPGFPGPGSSTTAPEKPKAHGSKFLNKLDPRVDHDIMEAKQKGDLGDPATKPGVSKDWIVSSPVERDA